MSFINRLSQTTAQARRDEAERKRLYDLETERLVDQFVATEKEEFMEECEEAAKKGQNSCSMNVYLSDEVKNRNGAKDVTEQKLRAMLVELGFHDGTVERVERVEWRAAMERSWFLVSATWPEADAAGQASKKRRRRRKAGDLAASPEEPPQKRAGGTFITCPICQEHRPAVVLIPCGHVVCRNCQHHQQFRQCPMCRGPVSSASNGLFMD